MAHPVTRCLGIRREDKNRWERRVPLTPTQVAELISKEGLTFQVEASALRTFADEEYARAGAELVQGMPPSPIVLGVKEIPIHLLQAGRVYFYFSHTIKGQSYNMPMLRRLLELGCTLLDYERVVDANSRRLVFFGRHAGLAGMMDSLWALGKRLAWEGMTTPLARLEPTYHYANLERVKAVVRGVGADLREQGIPESLRPCVVGFAGYGNVSRGAQEIFDLLEPIEVGPEELLHLDALPGDAAHQLYKVVFKEEHMVEPLEPGRPFVLQEYFQSPELFRSAFGKYLPALTMLVNGIYWTTRYPRLVTCAALRELYSAATPPRLRVFGDISCDVEGSIECTVRSTSPDDPIYVWDPKTGQTYSGVAGQGPVVLAVDNLPCELPADASQSFGEVLSKLMPALARADFDVPFAELVLPSELKRAVIVHRGELTPGYRYLEEFLANS